MDYLVCFGRSNYFQKIYLFEHVAKFINVILQQINVYLNLSLNSNVLNINRESPYIYILEASRAKFVHG